MLSMDENPLVSTSFAALRPGARIGVVAPSGVFERDRFDQGIAVLRQLGFDPAIHPRIYRRERYFAGDDALRAQVLMDAFLDPEIDAIIFARGGYGAMRLLPRIGFDTIARHPKPFIGFSDATALINCVAQRSAMIAFHGPVVTSLADADELTGRSLQQALSGPYPLCITAREAQPIRPGRARGTVFGGNLTTLCHLLATPFALRLNGSLLFLEDVNEAPYRIDRMLTQMRLAGCFNAVAGIALGEFNGCGDAGLLRDVFSDILGSLPIPVLSGLPVGHGKINHTIPIGATGELDTGAACLRLMIDADDGTAAG